jgi:alanine racemase
VRAAEIRLSRKALKNNFQNLRKLSAGLSLFPVIKANAYGHGAALIAAELEKNCDEKELPMFCVAQFKEALELREAGIRRRILILSSFEFEDLKRSKELSLSFVVSSPKDLESVLGLDSKKQSECHVHLNFNTGMNRLGISSREFETGQQDALVEKLCRSSVHLEGAMTHLARSEEDPALLTNQQVASFAACLTRIKKFSPRMPTWIHISNSASMHRSFLPGLVNAARPGLRLLGSYLDLEDLQENAPQQNLPFEAVLSLHLPIRNLFTVKEGEGVGYGQRFKARRDSLLATVCVGHADGICRQLGPVGPQENGPGEFIVENLRCPSPGRFPWT